MIIFPGSALDQPSQVSWKLALKWLVNALAYEICFEMKEGRDREKDIS
jgi:hypothetical protein